MDRRALTGLAAGGALVALLAGMFISGTISFDGGDQTESRPIPGGPPGLRLAEGNVTVIPRPAVSASEADSASRIPAAAEPLVGGDVGVGSAPGGGPTAAASLASIGCEADRLLRTEADGSTYFIEIAATTPWNCGELVNRWRPMSGSGQRVGIRYQEGAESRPSYVTLFGENGSLLFAVNGVWVLS